jgi:quinol monooxygenase YgiN
MKTFRGFLAAGALCIVSTSVARSADIASVTPDLTKSSKDKDEVALPASKTVSMASPWTIQPYFSIPKTLHWPSIMPYMNRLTAATEAIPRPARFGWGMPVMPWSAGGANQLMWKGIYDNFEDMQSQHESIMQALDELVSETGLTLDRLEIHGSAKDLIEAPPDKKLHPGMALRADFFDSALDVEEGFSSKMSPDANLDRACETSQYFSVNDWKNALPVMKEFVKKTNDEPGCLYSGWSKKGTELRWRETYEDGDAVVKHFKETGPLIEKLIDGPAKLERFEIHGPKEELKKAKNLPESLTVAFKPDYFAIASDGSEEQLLASLDEISDEPFKKDEEL